MAYSEAEDFKTSLENLNEMHGYFHHYGIKLPNSIHALDVGGGGGTISGLLSGMKETGRVYCTDIIDENARFNGQFVFLLEEKFRRNDKKFDAHKFEFHQADAMSLHFKDNLFDLAVSFNAFEHIPNPQKAFFEILRVLKPGGFAYISFAPLWTSDTGHHIPAMNFEPWSHLVYPEEIFIDKMMEYGSQDNEVDIFLHEMNRWTLSQYKELDKIIGDSSNLLFFNTYKDFEQPKFAFHQNYYKCLSMGYSKDELTTRGIKILFQKI